MNKLKNWWALQESGTRKTLMFFLAFVVIVLGCFFGRDVWNADYQWAFEGKYTLLLVLFLVAVIGLIIWKSRNSKQG